MKHLLGFLLSFVLLIAPASPQTATPQIGGGIGLSFDGGIGKPSASSPYLLNELFSRYADSTVMSGQVPLVGPAWSTTGATLPTIASSKLITTATGSGYLVNTLTATPQSIYVEMDWNGGADLTAKGMTIAYADSSGTFLNDLLHLNYGPLAFNLSVRQAGGAFNSILTGSWKTPMSNGGATNTIALAVSGQKVTVLDPGGGLWSVSDSRVPSVVGARIFYEPGLQADGLQARVSKAYAYKSQGFTNVNYTAFNPADISAGLTLSNNNWTVAATTATANKQVRSVDTNTNQDVYFELTADLYGSPASQSIAVGLASASHLFSSFMGQDTTSLGVWLGNNVDVYFNNVATRAITGTMNQGDVIGVRINFNTKLIYAQNVTKATGFNPAQSGAGISFSSLTGAPYFIDGEIDASGPIMSLNTGQAPYTSTVPVGAGNWLNFLLKRDIDPAANDNSPMWLERVA